MVVPLTLEASPFSLLMKSGILWDSAQGGVDGLWPHSLTPTLTLSLSPADTAVATVTVAVAVVEALGLAWTAAVLFKRSFSRICDLLM